MDLVLDEKDEHVDVETRFIQQNQIVREMAERQVEEGRNQVIQTAEKKYVLSIAMRMKECKRKHVADERSLQSCMNNIRDEVLGPMPSIDEDENENIDDALSKYQVHRGHSEQPDSKYSAQSDQIEQPEPQDPAIVKRVLQIFAAKRESMNLLRNELDLVQKLGHILTGEALDGELTAKIQAAAYVAQARAQSRKEVSQLVQLNLMPKEDARKLLRTEKSKEPVAMAGMAMEPQPPILPPLPVNHPVEHTATEWELYKAKLDHAAKNKVHGLGPNRWNPTKGETFEGEKVGMHHTAA
jgi:hypothetical protein